MPHCGILNIPIPIWFVSFFIMSKKFVNQENIEEEFICQVMLNEKI